MRAFTCCAIALMLLLSACGSHKSADEQLVKSLSAAMSWVPSLQMTGEKWITNSVPENFVTDAADAADREFEKAQQTSKSSKASSDLRSRVERDLRQAHEISARLRAAVEVHDRRIAADAIQPAPALQRDFEAINKRYGSSQ